YLDVIKDRLYADAAGSTGRRSAQTVLAAILTTLVRLIAPVLTFTTEEVWQFMPAPLREGAVSVQLAGWPTADVPTEEAARLRETYGVVLEVRDVATKALEDARNAGAVGKSQEALLVVSGPEAVREVLAARADQALAEMFIVSEVVIGDDAAEISVSVDRATGEKCPRCWNWRELETDGLCARCSEVVRALA
ncbi:MAG: class I tRNA ligase family protein, partial [Coriobacteriia bacterium]